MLDLFDGSSDSAQVLAYLEQKLDAGLFSRDLQSGEVRWSAGMFKLFGLIPDSIEPTLQLFQTFEHPEDRISLDEWYARASDALPFTREYRIVVAGGRMRWLSASYDFVLDSRGKAVRLLGVCIDVTARRAGQLQTHATQTRFTSAVMGVAPAVYIADPSGKTTDLFGWGSLAGRPDTSGLGLNWVDALHPDDRDGTLKAWRYAVESKTLYEHECRLLQPEQAAKRIRAYAAPAFDTNRRVTGWNGIVVDVSEKESGEVRPVATGAQIRAARGLLRWSVAELAQAAAVSSAIIRRIEDSDEEPKRAAEALASLRNALECAGVEFIFERGSTPGIRPAPIST